MFNSDWIFLIKQCILICLFKMHFLIMYSLIYFIYVQILSLMLYIFSYYPDLWILPWNLDYSLGLSRPYFSNPWNQEGILKNLKRYFIPIICNSNCFQCKLYDSLSVIISVNFNIKFYELFLKHFKRNLLKLLK